MRSETVTLSPSADAPSREGAGKRIAAELRDAILRGEHPPGTRIRQETIASDYGASRVPVREAFRILEADGLVTLVANTGAWVAKLSQAECDEIYHVRGRLEPLLLRMSAEHLTPTAIERIAALADEMREVRDVERFLELDREFHMLSYSGATTAMLGDTVTRLWNSTQHYRRAYTLLIDADSSRLLHEEHHMLASALRSHDLVDAERVLHGHIRRTRKLLGRHPEIFN